MLKRELRKRLDKIEGAVFEAQMEVKDLISELEEDQGRISNDDMDRLIEYESKLDCARSYIT